MGKPSSPEAVPGSAGASSDSPAPSKPVVPKTTPTPAETTSDPFASSGSLEPPESTPKPKSSINGAASRNREETFEEMKARLMPASYIVSPDPYSVKTDIFAAVFANASSVDQVESTATPEPSINSAADRNRVEELEARLAPAHHTASPDPYSVNTTALATAFSEALIASRKNRVEELEARLAPAHHTASPDPYSVNTTALATAFSEALIASRKKLESTAKPKPSVAGAASRNRKETFEELEARLMPASYIVPADPYSMKVDPLASAFKGVPTDYIMKADPLASPGVPSESQPEQPESTAKPKPSINGAASRNRKETFEELKARLRPASYIVPADPYSMKVDPYASAFKGVPTDYIMKADPLASPGVPSESQPEQPESTAKPKPSINGAASRNRKETFEELKARLRPASYIVPADPYSVKVLKDVPPKSIAKREPGAAKRTPEEVYEEMRASYAACTVPPDPYSVKAEDLAKALMATSTTSPTRPQPKVPVSAAKPSRSKPSRPRPKSSPSRPQPTPPSATAKTTPSVPSSPSTRPQPTPPSPKKTASDPKEQTRRVLLTCPTSELRLRLEDGHLVKLRPYQVIAMNQFRWAGGVNNYMIFFEEDKKGQLRLLYRTSNCQNSLEIISTRLLSKSNVASNVASNETSSSSRPGAGRMAARANSKSSGSTASASASSGAASAAASADATGFQKCFRCTFVQTIKVTLLLDLIQTPTLAWATTVVW